jgi:hypothetical protein
LPSAERSAPTSANELPSDWAENNYHSAFWQNFQSQKP